MVRRILTILIVLWTVVSLADIWINSDEIVQWEIEHGDIGADQGAGYRGNERIYSTMITCGLMFLLAWKVNGKRINWRYVYFFLFAYFTVVTMIYAEGIYNFATLTIFIMFQVPVFLFFAVGYALKTDDQNV